jgi:hypothetical protein
MKEYLNRNSAVIVTGILLLLAMLLLALKLKAFVLAGVQTADARYQNLRAAIVNQLESSEQGGMRLSSVDEQLASMLAVAKTQGKRLETLGGQVANVEALTKTWAALQGAQAAQYENLKAAIANQIATIRQQGNSLDAIASGSACGSYIDSLPAKIDKPGTYCLSKSFDNSMKEVDAITIAANEVTINGRGLLIAGPSAPSTSSRGILAVDQHGLTITDLRIEGFAVAVLIGDTTAQVSGTTLFPSGRKARDILIDGVRSDNASFQGFQVSADNFTIRDSTVTGVGPSTVVPHSFATGILARGNLCRIHGNLVSLGDPTGSGENIGIAVNLGSGCLIDENVVHFDKYPQWGHNFGIWTKAEGGALPEVTRNLVAGAHYAYGPHGIFVDNVSENAACALFVQRRTEVDLLADVRGNTGFQSNGSVRPGPKECPDDPARAEARFKKSPSDLSAYAVALALAEVDPVAREMDTLAWLLVAAEFGHTLAKPVADNPASGGYKEATIAEARKMAESILGGLGPKRPAKGANASP